MVVDFEEVLVIMVKGVSEGDASAESASAEASGEEMAIISRIRGISIILILDIYLLILG